jgi:hypothetical protein
MCLKTELNAIKEINRYLTGSTKQKQLFVSDLTDYYGSD